MSLGDDKQAYKEKSEVKKTGTDDQPVIAYKPVYKKLTKNAYSECQQSSTTDSKKGIKKYEIVNSSPLHKPLEIAYLDIKKNPLSSSDNSGFSNEADATRTRNLRIDSPNLRFVSICVKSVYDCKIKTYETNGKQK